MQDVISKYSKKFLNPFKNKQDKNAVFNEIYDKYASTVHAYCVCIAEDNDLAEDLFQETFIRFYNNIDTIDNISNLIGYLLRIARNLNLNIKRNKKNNIDVQLLEDVIPERSISYDSSELLEIILASLEFLEPMYREIFIMHEFEGLDYRELSKSLNISVANSKTRYLRAKQQIIKILKPYIDDLNR